MYLAKRMFYCLGIAYTFIKCVNAKEGMLCICLSRKPTEQVEL